MSDRKEFRDLATPEAAREAIDDLDLAGAGDSPLEDARGRVLAERIDAAIDVPGFDRASMDGYAVRPRHLRRRRGRSGRPRPRRGGPRWRGARGHRRARHLRRDIHRGRDAGRR